MSDDFLLGIAVSAMGFILYNQSQLNAQDTTPSVVPYSALGWPGWQSQNVFLFPHLGFHVVGGPRAIGAPKIMPAPHVVSAAHVGEFKG